MTNDLKTFTNDQFGSLRTVTINSEPWFVAADVCRALEISNPSDALELISGNSELKQVFELEMRASAIANELYGRDIAYSWSSKPVML